MEPYKPPEETLFSKLLVIGALVLLVVILGACVFVIYGYVFPAQDPDSIAATPVPTPTPTPTPSPTPTPVPGQGQFITVRGTITYNGNVVQGATVVATPGDDIDITDANGAYDINVPTGSIVTIMATYNGNSDSIIVDKPNTAGFVNGQDIAVYSSPTATPTPTPVYQMDTQVTFGRKIMDPGVWERYIVYDESVGPNNYNVHLYDILLKTDLVIATGNIRSYGCIGSGKVGLINEDTTMVYLYDISAKTKIQVSPDNKIPRMYPSINSEQIIYTGNDGASNPVTGWIDIFTLYQYDFPSGTVNMLMHDMPQPNEPRSDGDYVVWWDVSGGSRNIVLYDKKTCKSKTINAAGAGSDHPRISGKTVVYHSVVGGADHIYSYDIDSGATRGVTSEGMQYYADVSGNRIVYDDNRDGKWDIYMFDRSTMQETRLTTEPNDQMMPQISGNNVIYMDNRNYDDGESGWDLFVLRL